MKAPIIKAWEKSDGFLPEIHKAAIKVAYEFNDRFVLKFQENNSRKFNRLIGGKKVKENFEYSSDKNIFLSLKQIQEFIK